MSLYRTVILQEQEKDLWDSIVNLSEDATVFHQFAWLKAAEEHSQMRLLPLAVYKGTRLVCLCPLFSGKKYGLKILLSPPNSCAMPFLGPIFNIEASNRYNYEKTCNELLDEIMLFSEKIGYDYFSIIHVPEIKDIRAYKHRGFSFTPLYTYLFNLHNGQDYIFGNFHRPARNILQKAHNNNHLSISHDPTNAIRIMELLKLRYAEQDLKFKITKDYFNSLTGSPIKDNIEVISAVCQEQLIGGYILLVYKKKAYVWLGTVNRDENFAGAGELVLWEMIKDLISRDISSLDFVGANTPHISKHKLRYGADLIPYFEANRTSFKGKIALKLFNLWRKRA